MAHSAEITDIEQFGESPQGLKDYWASELKAGNEAQQKWHKRAVKVVDRYRDHRNAGDEEWFRLNLFYSNVQTTSSMLFGKLPEVTIDRRNNDFDDDVGRVAAMILQRALQNDIGTPNDQYSDTLRMNLQDRLISGMGVARVRYEMDKEAKETAAQIDMNGKVLAEGFSEEIITAERAPIEYVYWKDFLWSPCRIWREVRWVGFKTRMTREQCIKRFGEKIGKKIPLTEAQKTDESPDSPQQDAWKRAEIIEIWDKDNKKVYWYNKDMPMILDEKEDPLKLTGFFPCVEPMTANLTTTAFMPIPDFIMAQDLYNEIDKLETRIATITQAIKVVGVYDKSADGIKRMLSEGVENDLIPVDNWAMFAEKGGLKGMIDWLPIESIASVLQQLTGRRNDAKAQLFEVVGMSDIMRGAQSAGASNTATQTSLEARFASVRIQALQDAFAAYATDLIRLRAEIMTKHFSPESIYKQSNIQYTPDAQNPELLQAAMQLIENREDLIWRIQVKPESVSMVDYAQLKQERTDYLTAVATFLQSSAPIMEAEPGSGPMLMQLLKWALAGFKGSQEIEGVIDKALESMGQKEETPEEQQPDPEMMKLQAEQQFEQQKFEAEAQFEMQKMQTQAQIDQQSVQGQLQVLQTKVQGDQQIEAQKHQNNLQRIQAELQSKQQEKQGDIQQDIIKENAQMEANVKEDAFETEQYAIRETHKANETIRVETAKTVLSDNKDID